MKYKLEEIATFSQGKQVSLKEQYSYNKGNSQRFIRIVDYTNPNEPIRFIDDYGKKYYANKDDLVMIRYGSQTAGKVVMGKSGIIANNMFKINLNNKIVSNKYMYYYLSQKNILNYLRSAQSSSTMPAINFGMLNNFVVNIPKLEKQEEIVRILEGLDKKIELNNKVNDSLFDLGDTLYKEYFESKAELPRDWKVCKLKEIANNYDAKRKPMSSREREKHPGKYPYYGAASIIDYVKDYIFDGIYLLMGEDGTVVTNDGTPILQYIWGKTWVNNHAHVLEGKMISTEHLMFCLRNYNVTNIITGAVQPKINQENMNNISIVLADEKTNKKYEKTINLIMKQYKSNIEENRKLEQLRETLLPKLMNGEIKLDKIEN